MTRWQIWFPLSLIAVSALLYYAQILLFNNPRDTAFYLFQDLAFVPVQVLLITVLLNQFLAMRERKVMRFKLNMLIGVFFSEMGTELARSLASFDGRAAGTAKILEVRGNWARMDYHRAAAALKSHEYEICVTSEGLAVLKAFLERKRAFLTAMLANPGLLEHDAFTEMMWAVTHLAEELEHRDAVDNLPANDLDHLSGDIRRALALLVLEWLSYMEHLHRHYPYLFSLATRSNPFHEKRPVVIP